VATAIQRRGSLILIFIALLVIATLDKIPDPPAANPGATRFSSFVYKSSVPVVIPNHFISALFHLPLAAVADFIDNSPRKCPIVLVDHAADLPPPPSPSLTIFKT